MGFLTSKTRPLPDVERVQRRNAAVGVIIKAAHDERPPESGVTRLPPVTEKIWNKKARRYRYARGVKTLVGKNLGGRFTTAPDDAPSNRKRKKPRR